MPWVSRKDLDRLYGIIDRLADHKVRTERVASGLPETTPLPKKPLPPMPADVVDYLLSHEEGPIRDRHSDELTNAAKRAGGWESVQHQIQRASR